MYVTLTRRAGREVKRCRHRVSCRSKEYAGTPDRLTAAGSPLAGRSFSLPSFWGRGEDAGQAQWPGFVA